MWIGRQAVVAVVVVVVVVVECTHSWVLVFDVHDPPSAVGMCGANSKSQTYMQALDQLEEGNIRFWFQVTHASSKQ